MRPPEPIGVSVSFQFDEDVDATVEAVLIVLRRAEQRRLGADPSPEPLSPVTEEPLATGTEAA
jgi:hypothetical protein